MIPFEFVFICLRKYVFLINQNMKTKSLIAFLAFFYFYLDAFSHDWTYTAVVSNQSGGALKTFYLWLPPQVSGIRGVILTAQGRLSQLSGDSTIRKACKEAELGIVGCMNLDGNFAVADTQYINNAMASFALQARLPELKNVPFASYGTSVGGIFAWEVSFAYPNRFFGIIEDNAIWTKIPAWATQPNQALQVPFLVSRGAVEPVQDKHWVSRDSVLALRALGAPANMILHAGCGHFSWTNREAKFMARWLKNAVEARIPGGAYARLEKPVLKTINENAGWLGDTTFTSANLEIASYDQFSGNKAKAFWFFDEELATFWKNMHQGQFQKTIQTGSYANSVFNNCTDPWQNCNPGFNLGVNLNINPNATASSSLPVRYGVYNGPYLTDGNLVNIDPNLVGETATGWIYAVQEGDATTQGWERAVRFRTDRKTTGQDQTLTVEPIADKLDTEPGFSYVASSSSGLPVYASIRSGPAIIAGNQILIQPFSGDSLAKAQVVVRYIQPGDATYKTSSQTVDTFWVTKSTPLPLSVKKNDFKKLKGSLYPNPSSQMLFWEGNKVPERMEVFNLTGQKIWSAQGAGFSEKINISAWKPGCYQVNVFSEGEKTNFTLIKE